MTERLLQFIWQFQYFDGKSLLTAAGDPLQILFPGQFNRDQGPDFSGARIRIGEAVWAGSVELHLKSSDWQRHGHGRDENYRNVILHVVWQDDRPENASRLPRKNGKKVGPGLPLLELQQRVPKILLQRYEELMYVSSFIPCERSFHSVSPLTWSAWKDRLVAERLFRKTKTIETFLKQNNNNWEETCWWLLARNFGVKVNADAFESLARSIPLNLLYRQSVGGYQREALLFGQARLLSGRFREEHPRLLQKEYQHLKKKYRLQAICEPIHFLRMRPGNFPSVRLAQLGSLLADGIHLFSKIRDAGSFEEIRKWLDITAADYWNYHYRFDEPSNFKKKRLGKAMIDTLLINCVCPILFAYGSLQGEQQYKEKALQWLERMEGEDNAVINGFCRLGAVKKNAFDSQALLELKSQYCNEKRCLDCAVGNELLKKLSAAKE